MPQLARITQLAIFIYLPLALAGVAWARLGGGRLAWSLDDPWLAESYPLRLAISLGLGGALAQLVVVLTPWLVGRAKWARALHEELKPLVETLPSTEIWLLALASGLAEELFFRGAMQPVLGLWLTSVIFGAVHIGPKRALLPWSMWAFVMGLVFGALFELTGVLWGPVFAHVWINARNMAFIQRH